MRRGTTPTHFFGIPFDIPAGSKIRIVYAQNNKVILERTTETCAIKEGGISVTLTDKETLKFDCKSHYSGREVAPIPIEIQIGIKTPDGCKLWSDIITTDVERCLREDGVI